MHSSEQMIKSPAKCFSACSFFNSSLPRIFQVLSLDVQLRTEELGQLLVNLLTDVFMLSFLLAGSKIHEGVLAPRGTFMIAHCYAKRISDNNAQYPFVLTQLLKQNLPACICESFGPLITI